MKGWFWGSILIIFGGVILLRNVFGIDIEFCETAFPILLILWGASMLATNLKPKK